MKKTKLYAKKTLSVFMAVMMLMTAWVFVAPEKAEAAADVAPATTYATYHVKLTAKFTNIGNSGHIIIYYYPVNADGSLNTSVRGEYILVNSAAKYSSTTWTFNTADDSTRRLSTDTGAETGPVQGWPCGVKLKSVSSATLTLTGLTIGNKSVVLNGGSWGAGSGNTKEVLYNNTGSGWDGYLDWPVPAVTSVRAAPVAQTVQVPKTGSASKTFTATFNDQYGVQWPSSKGMSAALSPAFSGTSVSLSGNTATVTGNMNVFNNSGYNSSNGQIKTTLQMILGDRTASCDVTFQAPKYNAYLQNFAGNTIKTYSNIGYYNQRVTLTDVPANTATTQIAGDDNYHQPYEWEAGVNQAFEITEDKTFNEVKSNLEAHTYGNWSEAGDNHTRTCSVCSYVQTQAHIPDYDNGYVTKDETCTEDGTMTYDCRICGKKAIETSVLNKIYGHDFSGDFVINVDGKDGTHWKKCSRCDVYGFDGQVNGCEAHNWDKNNSGTVDAKDGVVETPASCTTPGVRKYTCTKCSATYTEEIPATGHQNVVATAAKDVTNQCGGDGNLAFWTCADCGRIYTDDACTTEVSDYTDNDGDGIPDVLETKGPEHEFTGAYASVSAGENGKHHRQCVRYTTCKTYGPEEDHTWGAPAVTPATCLAEGKEVYTCTAEGCGQTYEKTLEKRPHAMTEIPAVAPECGKPGNNKYYSCSTCNKFYKDEAGTVETTAEAEKLKALEHTWKEHHAFDTIKTNATCQAAAVYNKHCDYCEIKIEGLTYSYGTPDTENGHQFDGEIRKNDDGTHSYKCTVPDCPEYGNATACEFTVPVADVASTCHTYGYTITKCATCGKENRVEKTTLDFTNHDGGTQVIGEISATCATNGYTGDTHCLGCGDKIADGKVITADKTVHPHENMKNYDGKEATCQVEGYTAYTYCDKCGTYAVEKVTIDKKTHKFTNYYTNNNGTHTAVCDTCKAENGEIATDTEDCSGGTANCVDKKVCTVCNTAYGDVDVNSHKTVVTIAKVPATCQTEGTQAYRFCEACDKALEEIVKIEKVAHSYSAWAKVDGEDKHERYCTTCDTDVAPAVTQTEDCYGGTAYCNALAKCATCKAEYGQLDPSNHSTESNHLVGAYDATCQAPGYTGDYHYDCCDVLKEEGKEIAQLEHTFDIEVEGTRVDATCIAKGEVTFKCSTCKEEGELKAATQKKELNIDSKNHASEETVTVGEKAATCESDGNTGDIYHKCCYDANKTEAENRKALISKGTVIKANGQHIYGAAVPEYMIKEIKETKDENDKVIKREFVLEEAPDYDAKIAARHEDGKWYHFEICTVCHEVVSSACYTYEHTYNCVETDECEVCSGLCSLIDENKHKADLVEVTEGAKAATCVSNGVKSYYKCADCDKTFFDEAGKKPFDPENEEHQAALVIDKSTVGHTIDWETPDVEVEGNCGTSGYKLYKCSVTGCDYETTVNTGVASNKHTWKTEYDVIKEATCGTNGYQAIKCEVCGATKSNSTVIVPATEKHDFDKNKDGVVDRNDAAITEGIDCQTPGTLTYTCQVCEATKVETDTEGVSAHTWGEWVTKGGDCSTGILQERTCSVCNATEQQRITTDTHQFELYIEVLPTAQKDGYRIERCANCGIEERTELPYDASGEGGEGGETPDTPDTPETDKHVVDENIYTVHEKADCRHGEIRRYTCLLCGEMVEREVGEPTEHIWMTQTAEIATCTRPGHSEYKRCLICLKEDGRENYEQLKHTDGDGNGKCDYCNSAFYDDGEGSKTCGCICHKENFFMQIIYKIISFFWRLFKIGHSCDCGAVHY